MSENTGNTGNTAQDPKRQRDDDQEQNPNDPKRPRSTQPSRPFTPGLDPSRPWHGRDPVLGRLRLKDLKKNGYIDWLPANEFPPLEGDYQVAGAANIAGNDPQYAYTPIHPVFREENWIGLRNGDYQAMAPALRLASRLLSEPCVMTLFNGLCQKPMSQIHDPRILMRLGIDRVHRFFPINNDPPGYARSRNTVKLLYQMKDGVKFTFEELPSAWGITRRDPRRSGFVARVTHASIVGLNNDFIEVLGGNMTIKTMAKASTFTEEAARLRTHFLLASLLFHEFIHAFYQAWHESPASDFEPFYIDHRISELGLAFQQIILDGVVDAAGRNPKNAACAYGLSMFKFPGGMSSYPGRHLIHTSAAKYGITATALTMVSVKDCHKFFTKRFWDRDVPMSNGRALKLPWKFAVTNAGGVSRDFLPLEDTNVTPVDPQPRATSRPRFATLGFKRKYGGETSSEDEEEEEHVGAATGSGSGGQAGAQGDPGLGDQPGL